MAESRERKFQGNFFVESAKRKWEWLHKASERFLEEGGSRLAVARAGLAYDFPLQPHELKRATSTRFQIGSSWGEQKKNSGSFFGRTAGRTLAGVGILASVPVGLLLLAPGTFVALPMATLVGTGLLLFTAGAILTERSRGQ